MRRVKKICDKSLLSTSLGLKSTKPMGMSIGGFSLSHSLFFFKILCLFCLPVHQLDACCLTPGTGVSDGYELPCGYREWNLSPLQEEHLLLTAQPSL